jgi:hypothetical protein
MLGRVLSWFDFGALICKLDQANDFQTKLSSRDHLKSLLKIVLNRESPGETQQAWTRKGQGTYTVNKTPQTLTFPEPHYFVILSSAQVS